MANRLLREFEAAFSGKVYRHRSSTVGDRIALHLYEDLVELGQTSSRWPRLIDRVTSGRDVLNVGNLVKGRRLVRGKKGRRGDGTFGELVPGEVAERETGYAVGRGPVANVEIGIEMKIVATAMAKQLDRVISGVRHQHDVFRGLNSNAITVAIIGVNHADQYHSYEKDRVYPASPIREAVRTVTRLEHEIDNFDELIILPFKATNIDPFPFEWVRKEDTAQNYNASVVRIGNLYEARF